MNHKIVSMSTRNRQRLLTGLTLAGMELLSAIPLRAQTFNTLHSFTGSDGSVPNSSLTLSGTTLYGTTVNGGSSTTGTLFSLGTDGHGFTNLYSFTAAPGGFNSDGANPYSGLLLSNGTLYGTAYSDGQGFG